MARALSFLPDVVSGLERGHTYFYRMLAAAAVLSEDAVEWKEPAFVGQSQSFMTTERASDGVAGGPGHQLTGSRAAARERPAHSPCMPPAPGQEAEKVRPATPPPHAPSAARKRRC